MAARDHLPAEELSSWRRIRCAALALLVLAGTLPWLGPVDAVVARWLEHRQGCGLLAASRAIGTHTPLLSLVLAGTVLVQLSHRRRRALETILPILLALGTGTFAVGVLKDWIHRPRPGAEFLGDFGGSFPSGHVANTSLLSIALWTLWSVRGPRRLLVASVLAAVPVVVALARVWEARHWASDVVCSAALASSYGLLALCDPDRRLRAQATLAVFLGAVGLQVLATHGVHLALPAGRVTAETLVHAESFPKACQEGRLIGAWMCKEGRSEPGTGSWLRSRSGTLRLGPIDAEIARLRVVIRPPPASGGESCGVLRVVLDGRVLGERLVRPGWRSYVFDVPPGKTARRGSRVRFSVRRMPGHAGHRKTRRAEFREVTLHAERASWSALTQPAMRTTPLGVACRDVPL